MSTVSQPAVFATTVVPVAASELEPTRKRWTREEYYQLGEQGWFDGQRVELIDGEIILLSPQSPQHSSGMQRVYSLLIRVFGDGYVVRLPGPMTKGESSEPEPDVAVVRGSISDYDQKHPSSAVLIVEVSRSSLQYDLQTKPHLYASMAVQDYWVLDLPNRRVVVHRDPKAEVHAPFGYAYQSVTIVSEDGAVSPLEKPHASLAVADMLPPAEPDVTARS